MTEKARKIFDILGVEPEEVFEINDMCYEFKFTNNLELYYRDKQTPTKSSAWACREYARPLVDLLSGIRTIKPKPTKEDEIVIAYAKLCGYNYIAKDKSGAVHAYRTKPAKRAECPEWDNDGCYSTLHYNISFLSWEDAEPYYIGE